MKKIILPVALLMASSATFAEQQIEKPLLNNQENTTSIKNSNLDLFGVSRSFGDIIFVDDDTTRQNSAPKRTRVFTGYEYENIKFSKHPGQLLSTFVIADGSTRITDKLSMGYVIRETTIYDTAENNKYVGSGSNRIRRDTFTEIQLLPKYINWVNENFSYGVELGYEHIGDAKDSAEKQMYHIRPEINLGFGRNFLHLNTEIGWIDRADRGAYIETEPLYLYRLTDNFNMGAKFYYHAEDNDFRWRESAVRPLVQYRFANNTYLELRWEVGSIRTHDGSGYNYNNYALYTEIPFNPTFSLMADLQFKDQKAHKGNEWSWGDKEDIFAKVGFIVNF
ncbi:transporter [Proteus hauseri]|uniref:transporter n=1 Tax=Proteus hauseri TaxID=183417 RepID=UPI0032DBB7ED